LNKILSLTVFGLGVLAYSQADAPGQERPGAIHDSGQYVLTFFDGNRAGVRFFDAEGRAGVSVNLDWRPDKIAFDPEGQVVVVARIKTEADRSERKLAVIRPSGEMWTVPGRPLWWELNPKGGELLAQTVNDGVVAAKVFTLNGDISYPLPIQANDHPGSMEPPFLVAFSKLGDSVYQAPSESGGSPFIKTYYPTSEGLFSELHNLNHEKVRLRAATAISGRELILLGSDGAVIRVREGKALWQERVDSRRGYYSLKVSPNGQWIMANWGKGASDILDVEGRLMFRYAPFDDLKCIGQLLGDPHATEEQLIHYRSLLNSFHKGFWADNSLAFRYRSQRHAALLINIESLVSNDPQVRWLPPESGVIAASRSGEWRLIQDEQESGQIIRKQVKNQPLARFLQIEQSQ